MNEKEIQTLLASMTIEEKVAQMVQVPYTWVGKEKAEYYASIGVGSFLHVFGADAQHLQEIACSSGKKIPLLFGIDAIHGHALNKKATIFPTQLSMACSFNPNLVEQMAAITAEEVAADGLHWTFSPVLCLGRDLRWGRVAETFGEDKYLTAELGAAMVRGYQGEDISEKGKILACAKHYIGYGEAMGGRDSYDTEMTYRKLRNDFLPPFEAVVHEGCATVMTAYGSTDGTPCTADKKLLKDILKTELKFDGFVVTDWDNVGHLVNEHCVADNIKDASILATESGNDMIMSTLDYYETMVELVKTGKISEELIDEAVYRILGVKMKMGLFENPNKAKDNTVIGGGQELNKEIARDCIVLLKNDGILPLSDINGKRIAVIGDAADSVLSLVGDWTYFTHPDPNLGAKPEPPYCTLVQGIKEIAHNTHINYVDGKDISEAIDIAQESDIIIFAFGDAIQQTGEGKDRANLDISLEQQQLFSGLKETGKPIISVMVASKPLCVTEIVKESSAFLTGFNAGAFGGLALAEVIFGKVNPSGKLPISFPHHVGQQPTYYNYLSGWHCKNYVDMPIGSLFVFGEGLSYAKFEYRDLSFNKETLTLSIIVKNVGAIAGKETVQVYMRDKVSSVMTPIKQLIRFKKIELLPNEERKVEFSLHLRDFTFINRDEDRILEKGEFELMVGGSSKDEDLLKTVFYQNETVKLKNA